jgi:beta-lactamase regulating signal transducer with metallopeptidase domain/Leucine-rich repeat (LRR) protein
MNIAHNYREIIMSIMMNPLGERLAQLSIELVVMALLIWGLIKLIKVRSARLCAVLWILVLIKAIIGPFMKTPVCPVAVPLGGVNYSSFIGAADASDVTLVKVQQLGQSTTTSVKEDAELASLSGLDAAVKTEVGIAPSQVHSAAGATSEIYGTPMLGKLTLVECVVAFWFSGIFVMLGLTIMDILRIWRLNRTAAEPTAELITLLHEESERLQINRCPSIAVTDRIDSPALVGLMRPIILLPRWIAEKPGCESLRWILAHELMHLKMRDQIGIVLRRLAQTIMFFHPVVWWAGRRWEESMEMACDRALVAEESQARDYASHLFGLLKGLLERKRSAPASVGLFASRTQVGKRIRTLLGNPFNAPAYLNSLSKLGLAMTMLLTLLLGIGIKTYSDSDDTIKDKGEYEHLPLSVEIVGSEQWYMNYSLAAWVVASKEREATALLARRGDILMGDGEGDLSEYFFPYMASDGTRLSIKKDQDGVCLGDKRITLAITEDSLEWIATANENDIANLRLLICNFSFDDIQADFRANLQAGLRKLAKGNANIGILLDENAPKTLAHLLEIFDPWLLILGDCSPQTSDLALISAEPELEVLWLNADSFTSLELLTNQQLQRLWISNWNPAETGPLSSELKSLSSLTLYDASIENIASIGRLKALEELHLISCSGLTKLDGLSDIAGLKALNLTACEDVEDLSTLHDLKGLQWLALPPNISQAQFDSLIPLQAELRILELVECSQITKLTAVGRLKHLRSLVLLQTGIEEAHWPDLQNLRYLACDKIDKQGDFKLLQEALPKCQIYEAEPFCMGSGWILSLWLVAPLAWWYSRRLPQK